VRVTRAPLRVNIRSATVRYVDDLTDAIKTQLGYVVSAKDLLAYGLRKRLKEGYTARDFRADAMAGVVVGIVALPLSMALAVAVDLPPQHGLYTAIIAGVVCALLGGTRVQVTGPTAAFVVILVPVVHQFGFAGLLLAGMMAGVMLILMGIARFGKLMTFIPHPVTTGFTTGIALVIALLQLKDLLGLSLPRTEGTVEYVGAVIEHADRSNLYDLGVGVVTVILLLVIPRYIRRIPAPLIALVVVSAAAAALVHWVPGFHVTTIGSKYAVPIDGEMVRGIPPLPPMPMVPWHAGGAEFNLDYATIRALLPSAFAIAILGAIESLMSAVIADGMSGSTHDPNAELIALGVGNILCPFFGGIPATGALARTATNIKAGARSPLASVIHAIFVLACTIALAPLVAYLPMAAMAGLLLIVARNMSELRHFVRLVRVAPRSDVGVLLTCFTLTVFFDMVIAVTVGVLLAALLFMKRMAVMTRVSLEQPRLPAFELPPGIKVYEIAGPMFFGAAKTAMATLDAVDRETKTVILSMKYVPNIDATGLVAFETVLDRLNRSGRKVILAGVQAEVHEVLERAGIKRKPGLIAYAPDIETAASMAIVHNARASAPSRPPPINAAA
jgi:sulfate permease, SulP family